MNFETFDKKFSKVENLVCPPFVIAMKMAMFFLLGLQSRCSMICFSFNFFYRNQKEALFGAFWVFSRLIRASINLPP